MKAEDTFSNDVTKVTMNQEDTSKFKHRPVLWLHKCCAQQENQSKTFPRNSINASERFLSTNHHPH